MEVQLINKELLDVIFYADLPNMDASGPGREFQETVRTLSCEGTVWRADTERGLAYD